LKMDPSTTFKIKHQKHLFDEDIVWSTKKFVGNVFKDIFETFKQIFVLQKFHNIYVPINRMSLLLRNLLLHGFLFVAHEKLTQLFSSLKRFLLFWRGGSLQSKKKIFSFFYFHFEKMSK
jgi:hypothetical protein